jgi:hypothetical protein
MLCDSYNLNQRSIAQADEKAEDAPELKEWHKW